ncbi:MAG TPA: hypothetical protein VF665_08775 [Longimicrobium sp.]|jgi:hypothetical protein|uniref:hypothetical protein n=1 Tax=Longimicrobium sp. TaxID=2029185 RepID=UPI002ED7F4CB
MPTPTFSLVTQDGGFGLYQAGSAGEPGALHLSFLLVPGAGAPPAGPLTLQESWAYPGGYLFSAAPVTGGLAALAGALGLTGAAANQRALAWLTPQAPPVLALVPFSPGALTGQVVGTATVPVLQLQLKVGSGTSFSLSLDPPALGVSAGGVTLEGSSLGPGGDLSVSLDPADPGRITFSASWDAFQFYLLFSDDPTGQAYPHGGEVRYFYPAPGGGTAQLVYPVLPAPAPNALTLELAVALDPVNPADGGRTAFQFSGAPPALPLAAASTVSGAAVTLAPQAGAGFWLGLRPGPPPGGGVAAYLAPQGPFSLSLPGGPARLMCGTSAAEFLAVAGGDTLVFDPGHPAWAPAFGAGTGAAPSAGDAPGPVLDPTYSTAYVRVRPGGGNAPRGYYAQPSASVNYAPGAVAGMGLPGAVSAYVGDPMAAGVPLPIAPYAALYQPAPDGSPSPNAGVEPALFDAFEKQVLAAARHTAVPGDPGTGPRFANAGGAALAGGNAATPQGLLVQMNDGATPFRAAASLAGAAAGPEGTWQRLVLARSGDQYLAFGPGASGTVDGRLASVLMRDQLFLVVNAWDTFGAGMERELNVAGFNFEVAPPPGAGAAGAGTFLVFKYDTTRSLQSLICGDVSAWAEPGVFVTDVAAAQATLRQSLAAAGVPCPSGALGDGDAPDADGDHAFDYFRTVIAVEPAWTGILAFNAPINANGMPLDLQMLFAGIDGELYAHHFGVELNQLTPAGGDTATGISQSSLFGVIHYPGSTSAPLRGDPAPGDYDFHVEKLVVALRNSAITVFDCKVGMSIRSLFGRAVQLVPATADAPPGTVVIAGRYQRHGTVGTVTFTAAERAAFLFGTGDGSVRVLDRFGVTGATLVPVGSKDNGDGTSTITSRFTLSGALAFQAQPFPGVEGLDLFTYGIVGDDGSVAGVSVSGLALDIGFVLDGEGKKQGAARIAPDFTGLQLKDDPAGRRKGGLLTSLPCKLTSFLQDDSGITAAKLGGLPVNVAGLVTVPPEPPPPRDGGDGGDAADAPLPPAANWTTSSPRYAMRFSLPLGTLGSLAEAGASLDAFVVLGWGPSAATPDDDGAALYVQLPQASVGAMGFNLQGLIKTTFGDANLARVQPPGKDAAYVLLFNNVALSVLGIHFPPKVIVDFILFADPANPGTGSMGWSLAATQPG